MAHATTSAITAHTGTRTHEARDAHDVNVVGTALSPSHGAWIGARRATLSILVAAGAVALALGVTVAYADEALGVAAIGGALLIALVWQLTSERIGLTSAVVLIYIGLIDGYFKLKTASSYATLGRDLLLYGVVSGVLIRGVVRRERFAVP